MDTVLPEGAGKGDYLGAARAIARYLIKEGIPLGTVAEFVVMYNAKFVVKYNNGLVTNQALLECNQNVNRIIDECIERGAGK